MPVADFEDIEIGMHRRVDERLGDKIFVRIPPADFPDVPIKGFVEKHFDRGIAPDLSNLDPLPHRPRLKIRKELLPVKPDRNLRFKAAKLGADVQYQIAGDVEEGDAHWLFDVQKTSDV